MLDKEERLRETWKHKLWRKLSRKFPRFIPDPNLELYRQHDATENFKSKPPDDEAIDVHCVWAIEFYTPSLVDNLLKGLSAFGWDREDHGLANAHNPIDWVRRSRETARGGGSFHLGCIERTKRQGAFGIYRSAPLPDEVEQAWGSLFALTSSLTCFVMCFEMKGKTTKLYDDALRRDYSTYTEPTTQGVRIINPISQKRHAIESVKGKYRDIVVGWFAAYLPGLFSSETFTNDFPTCEFVTFKKAHPFRENEDGSKAEEYLWLLNVANDTEAWESVDTPNLKFSWPLFRGEGANFRAFLAANEDVVFNKEFSGAHGEPTRGAVIYHLNLRMNSLLSRWALLAVLSAFERKINSVRDSSAIRVDGKSKPLEVLETVDRFFSEGADIAALSSELERFSKERSFSFDVAKFGPCRPSMWGAKDKNITMILRETLEERAGWLNNMDRSIRDLLVQYGATVGTRENIRIQSRIGWLTWVLVALTIMIAVLTAVMAFNMQN